MTSCLSGSYAEPGLAGGLKYKLEIHKCASYLRGEWLNSKTTPYGVVPP